MCLCQCVCDQYFVCAVLVKLLSSVLLGLSSKRAHQKQVSFPKTPFNLGKRFVSCCTAGWQGCIDQPIREERGVDGQSREQEKILSGNNL